MRPVELPCRACGEPSTMRLCRACDKARKCVGDGVFWAVEEAMRGQR